MMVAVHARMLKQLPGLPGTAMAPFVHQEDGAVAPSEIPPAESYPPRQAGLVAASGVTGSDAGQRLPPLQMRIRWYISLASPPPTVDM